MSEVEQLNAELARLKVEQAKYELEEMKIRAGQREQKRVDAIRLQKQLAQDEETTRRKIQGLQKFCNHRKGGKDLQGLYTGNSTDYSVWHFIFPLGDERVYCSRCLAEWKPGDGKDHPSGFSYEEAMRWPTDNTTASSVTFTVPNRV